MNAQVKRDNTRRTIVVEVSGVPDIDITASYHKNPRLIRPDSVTIVVQDGEVSSLNISGGLVLKKGGVSDSVRDNQRWYGYTDRERAKMPEWLIRLAEEAPAGVVSWIEPEAQAL